jgi:hypothetical protein
MRRTERLSYMINPPLERALDMAELVARAMRAMLDHPVLSRLAADPDLHSSAISLAVAITIMPVTVRVLA